MSVREVRLVPYAEAEALLRADNGWRVAPEEDENGDGWKTRMVYLERFQELVGRQNLGIVGWWGLLLPRLLGRKVVSECADIHPSDEDITIRMTAYYWRGRLYLSDVEEL